MSITIKVYSEKGLVVKGITEAQAQAILGGLGKAVTQHVPTLGGYVFSRKREAQIREIVAEMQDGRVEVAMNADSRNGAVVLS